MQVADWLRGLALEQYAAAFEQNHIRWELLAELTADDLKELGVASVGHRRQLLAAIAALRARAGSEPEMSRDRFATTPEAERRQVTVMFCDLVGSTALSARLDPEDLREVIGGFQSRAARTITSFDGFVARYMGDGLLAYFGYPHAHEDDAEQAVRAGLALIDTVRELPAPQRLQLRVGIATGLVVVGDLIGAGAAQEQAIVGETPNLAARLQALAEPDTVVIAESTRRQIGTRFEVRDLGLQPLKGFAEPQRVWRALSENRALGRFEALRSDATPLIGRDEEMELLLRRWAQAKAGSGRVVLISGEPGVGKSRLAESLAERIAAEPHIRLRYFCSPHHQDSAFHPFVVQMERAAGFARGDAPEERLAKLQALLTATSLSLEDVTLIAHLHALPSPGDAPPLDFSPQRKKEKTFEALLRRVEGLSRCQPVLMMFEDIHWIDPSSCELLDRTIELIANRPALLLATFRPEFQPPRTEQPHVAVLTLPRLDAHDAVAMITEIAGNTALPTEIVHEIAERADGVPLFIEELTKAVLELGASATATLSAVPNPALSVPATLHASLMARLDRLGLAEKHVAQTGATIGREFAHELLASVADLPEPRLRQALDRLTSSGLLFVRGIPPRASYVFKHTLVQDAAYGALLRGRRQHLHARIGAILEDRFPEIVQTQPALLARHSTEAGLTEKAVIYWLKAGEQALARSAMTEAVAQLRKGLNVLAVLPDSPWRRQQELDLLIALGSALAATTGYSSPAVGQTFARARVLAQQLDRPEQVVRLMAGQWAFHILRAEHGLALRVGEEMEKIGRARNDPATQLLGRSGRGAAHMFLGDFMTSRSLFERSLGPADPALHTIGQGTPTDAYTVMLAYLAHTLAYLGYIDQARSRINEAVSVARQLKHAHTLAHGLGLAARLHSIIGPPELQCYDEELLLLSREQGFPLFTGWAATLRGRSLIALGKAKEGLALLREGLVAIQSIGAVSGTPELLTYLAAAHAMLEQPTVGLNCLFEAAQIIEATEERRDEANLHRVRGDLLNATGDRSAAERSYQQALAVARRQSAKLFELRTATSLARLWRNQGKRAEARDLLAPIYAWFTEGFDAPDLVEAKALIDGLG